MKKSKAILQNKIFPESNRIYSGQPHRSWLVLHQLVIVVPYHIRHLGPRQSIVLECGSKFDDVMNEPLPKSIILAHQYAQILECGRYKTVLKLARALKLDRSYVARTLSLVNLAPDIIVSVMQGKTPPQMTLAKAVNNLPENWQEQRELFGIKS